MTTTKVDTQVVIDFFDDFANKIIKNTVVILDNASIHTSKLFKKQIQKWNKLGLQLLFLPPYSPELNKIEILWKHMKYHHHKINAYLSFENLYKHVENLLNSFGNKYDINFN
jgi:transposase